MNNSAYSLDKLYSELSSVIIPIPDGTFFEGDMEFERFTSFINPLLATLPHFSYLMLHSFMCEKLRAIQQILLFDTTFLERND